MAGPLLNRVVQRSTFLEPLADRWQRFLSGRLTRGGKPTPLKQFLNGVWFGHPLHPAVTDVPIGGWTMGAVLDVAAGLSGSGGMAAAADTSIAFGCMGAVGAAMTGAADWSDLSGEARRAGTLHALLNTLVLGMNLVSLVKRWTGNRAGGLVWSMTALGVATVSAYIGGELVSGYGSGVTHEMWPEPPAEFTPVLAEAGLPEGKLVSAKAGDFPVCLLRRNGTVLAIGGWCTHLGGPLAKGELEGDTVTCPWHASQFDLKTGEVVQGPATVAARHFETRIRDGKVEVKPAPA